MRTAKQVQRTSLASTVQWHHVWSVYTRSMHTLHRPGRRERSVQRQSGGRRSAARPRSPPPTTMETPFPAMCDSATGQLCCGNCSKQTRLRALVAPTVGPLVQMYKRPWPAAVRDPCDCGERRVGARGAGSPCRRQFSCETVWRPLAIKRQKTCRESHVTEAN